MLAVCSKKVKHTTANCNKRELQLNAAMYDAEYELVTWDYMKDVVRQSGARIGDLKPLVFISNRKSETEVAARTCSSSATSALDWDAMTLDGHTDRQTVGYQFRLSIPCRYATAHVHGGAISWFRCILPARLGLPL